jgi:hypothetical protein
MGGSVTKSEAPHSRLNAQDVVVHREQLLLGSGSCERALDGYRHLGVINTREVAGAGGLVLLWLQSEGVHVDARVRGAGVVDEGLVLVEVLAELLLEAILAVEDNLKLVKWADLVREGGTGNALLNPGVAVARAGNTDCRVGNSLGITRHHAFAGKVQVRNTRQVRQDIVVGCNIGRGVAGDLDVLGAC